MYSSKYVFIIEESDTLFENIIIVIILKKLYFCTIY